eukprot:TRINITY_DN6079_c0_g1_i1.p1 TRINITY_DN6079_c0_g1~~TRINITY_DN6079_c0_g1_i1.p1  ORF type:complete len:377 (+),score=71.29 TRINITY_DN6079_c0_g1_i1:227-1357(+)
MPKKQEKSAVAPPALAKSKDDKQKRKDKDGRANTNSIELIDTAEKEVVLGNHVVKNGDGEGNLEGANNVKNVQQTDPPPEPPEGDTASSDATANGDSPAADVVPPPPAVAAAPNPPKPDSIETSVLKDLLECPVCLRVPRKTPIYQCARGHVVCSECKPNVNTCPQCRDVLGNIRSLVSEKVLEKLPSPCKYSDSGCQIEVMRSELPSHEKQCKYRLVNCVDLACQQPVSLANLLNHIDSHHETEDFVRVEGGEYSSHFIVNEEDFSKDIMWISDQLHFDQKYFYRECCRSNKGLWYIWLYQLDTDGHQDDYTCQISVMSADRQDMLTCTSRPLSLDYTKEKVAESGRGLVFTDSTARLFWEDNKVRYSVSIKRKQ